LRLDHYLAKKLPNYSRSKIQSYIKMGQVTINGLIVKPSFILQGNEIIKCRFESEPIDEYIIPEKIDLEIIFEDDHIAVINKPSGMVVHPGNGNQSGTLLNGLLYYFNHLSNKSSQRPGIVHRLDKETSGVIIVAKNDESHDNLSAQFSNRQIKKEYRALVWGEIDSEGKIEGKIGRHPKHRQTFSMVSNGGKDSCTNFSRINYLPPLSLVSLSPKTGRTHQLRVHLKSLGHPIFGDVAYGGGENNTKSFHVKYTNILNTLMKAMPRVALHAFTIEFKHPITEDKMKYNVPLPSDFNEALEILKYE